MNVSLSNRLMMSAKMAGNNNCVADIGCDHAHMDIWLLQQGMTKHCIAMDVRSGPLEKAARNLEVYGCSGQVELRLSNGFDALEPKEADCAFLTGMGGALMSGILEKGLGKDGHLYSVPPAKLILQPQSHVYDVRKWLDAHHWTIADENMVFEDGKYYVSIMALAPDMSGTWGADSTRQELNDVQLEFGPVLCRKKPEVFMNYLDMYSKKCARKIKELANSDTADASCRRERFLRLRDEAQSLMGN